MKMLDSAWGGGAQFASAASNAEANDSPKQKKAYSTPMDWDGEVPF